MQKGTIKFYNSQKEFGFIIEEPTGRDIFFHKTKTDDYEAGMLVSFTEGECVSFEEIEGKKGPEAINVKHSHGCKPSHINMDGDDDAE